MPSISDTGSRYRILRKWYSAVWEQGEIDLINEFYKDDVGLSANDLLPEHVSTAREVREWMIVMRSFVTDIKVDILQYMEKDDWASAVLELKCKRCDTDEPMRVMQLLTLRYEGDKVAEVYRSLDWIRFFEQLGQLPPDTHALLLGGTVLR